MGGERSKFRRVSLFVGDAVKSELSTDLNHGFRSRRIAFAGQLNENFIRAAAGECNRRFGETQRINAARDRLEGLVHRVFTKGGENRGFHVELVTVHLSRSGCEGPFGKLVCDQIAKRRGSGRGDIQNENLRIAYAANFADVDILLVKLFIEQVDRLIAPLANGFVDLHLKHEVAAALQIKAELDAVR